MNDIATQLQIATVLAHHLAEGTATPDMERQLLEFLQPRVKGRTMADPAPWHPETDPERLKVMGKTLEELGEGVAALARCIIQGIDEAEPVTGKINRRWVEEEFADILANIGRATRTLGLNMRFIRERRRRKFDYITRWLEGLTRPAEHAMGGSATEQGPTVTARPNKIDRFPNPEGSGD